MSIEDQETGANNEFEWRETYFILFKANNRPTLTQVEHAIGSLSDRLQLQNLRANDEGHFESLMVRSPDDYAAIEISYEASEAVIEQGTELAKQLRSEVNQEELAKLVSSDARLDLMHFEQMVEGAIVDDDEMGDMLDPSSLLMIVDALVDLTEGVAVDPASGAILS